MRITFQWAKQASNELARLLLVLGLATVGARNWRLWKRDKELATRLRLDKSVPPTLRQMPRISALVAGWNEHDRIEDHIRSFLALSYPNIELILCAGGDDDTFERALQYASE